MQNEWFLTKCQEAHRQWAAGHTMIGDIHIVAHSRIQMQSLHISAHFGICIHLRSWSMKQFTITICILYLVICLKRNYRPSRYLYINITDLRTWCGWACWWRWRLWAWLAMWWMWTSWTSSMMTLAETEEVYNGVHVLKPYRGLYKVGL